MSAVPSVVVGPIFVEHGENFRVTPDGTARIQPARAAALEGGGYVLTWVTNPNNGDSSTERVYAQVFDANGTALGAAFAVAPELDMWQWSPTVVMLEGGGFVIGWFLHEQDVDRRVMAQRYDSAGQPDGEAITVATLGT